MAIQKITNSLLYGLAADTKPTNYATNTLFYEQDTGTIYRYNGSSWDIFRGASKTETLINKAVDATTNSFSKMFVAPFVKDVGMIYAAGPSAMAGTGMFYGSLVNVGTPSASTPLNSDHGWYVNWASATTTNSFAGMNAATPFTVRQWNPYFRVKFAVPATGTSRCYIGLTSYLSPSTTDTLLSNTDSGVIFGYSLAGTNSANWNIYHNDGGGAMTVVTTSVTKDTVIHAMDMTFNTSVPNCLVRFYGNTGTLLFSTTLTTKLPAATTILYCNMLAQTTAASATNMRIYNAYIEHQKIQAPL